MRRFSPVWLLFLAPALWLAPMLADPNGLAMLPGAAYSDLAITHWPNAIFIHDSIAQFGQIPLWNPLILGGTPFGADPLSGLFYPPLWLAAAFPAPWAFNLLFFLHLALAGAGAYALARTERIPPAGALLAGLLFGGMSKFAAHIAAGHLTLVCAAAWTPWLMWMAARAARTGSVRASAWAGVAAGLVFLIDPRWALPAWSAAAAYGITAWLGAEPAERPGIQKATVSAALAAILAVGVSAPLALPLLEYLPLSTRALMTAQDGATLSLPPAMLWALLLPGVGGSAEWVIYPGAATLLLAAAGVWAGWIHRRTPAQAGSPRRTVVFWLGVLLFSILMSLGDSLPIPAYAGIGWLRVPPRWMFLAGLSLALLAARGMCAVADSMNAADTEKWTRWIGRLAVAAIAAGAGLATMALMRAPLAPLLQTGLAWCGIGVAVAAASAGRLRTSWALTAIATVMAADLAAADARLIEPHPADSFLASPAVVRIAADSDGGVGAYRSFSPSYSLPQPAAAAAGLRTLDGIDPLMLRSTERVVLLAARIPAAGYSVTLPPFATGNPATDNRDATPDFSLMSLLNVKYLASAYPLNSSMLQYAGETEGVHLYRTFFPMPRAWTAPSMAEWADADPARPARIVLQTPNRLVIETSGPGVLFVSEAMYPGWRATVNGREAAVQSAGADRVEGGWWRAVPLESGAVTVEMWFDPAPLWAGLALCALAMLACTGAVLWGR